MRCEILPLFASFVFHVATINELVDWLNANKVQPGDLIGTASIYLMRAAADEFDALLMSIGHTCCEAAGWSGWFRYETWPDYILLHLKDPVADTKWAWSVLFIWTSGIQSSCLIPCIISVLFTHMAIGQIKRCERQRKYRNFVLRVQMEWARLLMECMEFQQIQRF